MSKTLTCAMCGIEFESGWSDEEALAEMRRDFGDVPPEERVVICDDCYKEVCPQANPEQYETWKRDSPTTPRD